MLVRTVRTAVSGKCCWIATARFSALLRLLAAIVVVLVATRLGYAGEGQPVSAEISVDTSGGYARIVYRFNGDVDANVRMSNGILVVSFNVPVELSTDRLNSAAAGYVSAARRDPDGKGLRIALARKLALHSMQADDRLFVDLLPDGWKGPPPPLPQEVVEELARRSKEAERRQRQLRLLAQQKQMVVTRVRVAHQPTFSRYVFELPELVSVTAERNGDKLNLQFDAPLKFDLAEAKASLPPMIERIEGETGEQQTTIKFSFIGKVDIRSFREDNSYIIDVSSFTPSSASGDLAAPRPGETRSAANGAIAGLEVPITVPARGPENVRSAGREGAGAAKERATAPLGRRPASGETQAPLAARQMPPPGTPTPAMTFDPAGQLDAANRSAATPSAPAPDSPRRACPNAGGGAGHAGGDAGGGRQANPGAGRADGHAGDGRHANPGARPTGGRPRPGTPRGYGGSGGACSVRSSRSRQDPARTPGR